MSLRLRVVTWNLHGPPLAWRQSERFAAAARRVVDPAIPGDLPDFILFQEVWFPQKAEVIIRLLNPTYRPVDVPHGFFPGRKGGLLSFIRRDCGWQLRRHSFHQFTAEAPVWRFWEGDAIGDKGFQRLELEREGQALVVINTHLQAEYGDQRYADIRQRQFFQIAKHIEEVPAAVPVLLGGDLNTRPNEPLYAQMAQSWSDLTADLRAQCKCGTTVPDGRRSEWIDYLLIRSGSWDAHAERSERIVSTAIDVPYSDHHGLDLTLQLAPQTMNLATTLALQTVHGPSTRRAWLLALAYLGMGRWRQALAGGRSSDSRVVL